jgi:hypothetical protein
VAVGGTDSDTSSFQQKANVLLAEKRAIEEARKFLFR